MNIYGEFGVAIVWATLSQVPITHQTAKQKRTLDERKSSTSWYELKYVNLYHS